MAVAGLGAQGLQLIDCLTKTEKAQLVAVIDVDSRVADRVSKEQGVPRFLSIQEMAAGLQGEVDGLIISVPNSLHLVTVTEALNLGLHVQTPPQYIRVVALYLTTLCFSRACVPQTPAPIPR